MNRNQIFTTIEFIDDLVRMSIGEYYNEKFHIFDTFKCPCSGLEASNIINAEEVEIRRMVLEGALALQEGASSIAMESRLQAFIPLSERKSLRDKA